jgi:glutamyl-Q tRNA(Asp) synthetase
MALITRFAPSPTGCLHLGHAYSAWMGRRRADSWRLRLEDIDTTRCKAEFAQSIQEDLAWLGLAWDGEVRVQSSHFSDYAKVLESLQARGLLYPCFCTRAEIARAQSAPHAAEGLYPGICRELSSRERTRRMTSGEPYALRLDTERAYRESGTLRFFDETVGWITAQPQRFGDVVLARKDIPTSYHLCVVHDDAFQQITHVIRGEDLLEATHIQVLLQALLGYESPIYIHHKLFRGTDGKRLAKRDKAMTLRALRDAGRQPADILKQFEAV